ncbi:hypothetical protein AX774_g7743 [Zancudomyces culisetae]|uniref:Uncharacterized protein n=1 Tax=Zancudomyces culisetae TaxID=1213189 RepID=A0A1R1PD54_ZANCU|nr:hypothetical protein AX774_g7743 [Zancudomyces culisetae]|eukprot:OMH78863.1 hypothetical protein AX774_g7743 [Zancudomyces culisetae]
MSIGTTGKNNSRLLIQPKPKTSKFVLLKSYGKKLKIGIRKCVASLTPRVFHSSYFLALGSNKGRRNSDVTNPNTLDLRVVASDGAIYTRRSTSLSARNTFEPNGMYLESDSDVYIDTDTDSDADTYDNSDLLSVSSSETLNKVYCTRSQERTTSRLYQLEARNSQEIARYLKVRERMTVMASVI